MAGFTPEQEQMMKSFFEMMQKFGGATEKATKTIESLSDVASRGGPELETALEQLRLEMVKKTKPEFGALTKEIITGKSTFKSMQDQIDRLDKAIEETADGAEKAQMMATRNALHDQETRQRTRAELTTFTAQFGKTIVNGAASAVAGLVKGLQAGSSGTELASGMMTAAVDVATAGAKGLGNGIAGVGGVMQGSLNPRMRALGMVAGLAGTALSGLSEAAGKVAKFGIEVLAKEVEKTVTAFNTMSASGAMFTDGMQGMRNASRAAGLTVDQFSKVVSGNSETIARSGLGMTEGVKRIGGALNAGGERMKKQLLNLGYSFEEQAALTAETMAQMRGAGGPLKATDAQIAQQTQRYAENLRTIAAITGEDAKKKSEQVKQQANQLAFQQKLAGMEPTQRAKVIDAMKNMSDIERKNFMDMVNFGTVINKEGAVLQAMSGGLSGAVNEYYSAFQQGSLDDKKARDISAQYADQQRKDYLENTALGIAGAANVGGLTQQLAESMGKELEFRNVFTKEAILAAEAGVQGQKNTTDQLTQNVTDAAVAAQNLKLRLEELMDGPIAKFSQVTKKMLEAVEAMVNEAMGKLGKDGKPTGPSTKDKAINAALGAAEGAMMGAMVGSIVPAIGTGVGAAVGGVIGGIKGWFSAKEGKSKGGIATGPESGYLEKLHGEEAVIPTVGGRVPLDVTVPMTDPAQVQKQLDTFGTSIDTKVDSLGGSIAKSIQPAGSGKDMSRFMKPIGVDVSSDKLDLAGNRMIDASNKLSDMSQFMEPVDFAKTDFGGQLFDSLQNSNKDLLLAGTQMSDAAKRLSTSQTGTPATAGKGAETYTINGKPASKEQFDKFMVDNPELGKMLGSVKPAQSKPNGEQKPVGLAEKLGLNTGSAVGAAIGTALLPGIGTLVGGAIGTFVDRSKQDAEKTGSVLNSVEQKLSTTFSDKGPVGTFFKDRGTAIGAGAATGAVVGGPLGAVVGGLTGMVGSFVQEKDAEKKRLLEEAGKAREEKERLSKTLPGITRPEGDTYKGMLERFDQLLIVNEKQMKNQQDMLDVLARQKDIAERHYQSSL
jgi:hypothetical protein